MDPERQSSFQRRLVKLEPQFVPLLCSVLLLVIMLPVTGFRVASSTGFCL